MAAALFCYRGLSPDVSDDTLNDELYGWDGKFDYTAGLLIIAGVVGVETRRELRTECGSY